jgi:hypothetical protein
MMALLRMHIRPQPHPQLCAQRDRLVTQACGTRTVVGQPRFSTVCGQLCGSGDCLHTQATYHQWEQTGHLGAIRIPVFHTALWKSVDGSTITADNSPHACAAHVHPKSPSTPASTRLARQPTARAQSDSLRDLPRRLLSTGSTAPTTMTRPSRMTRSPDNEGPTELPTELPIELQRARRPAHGGPLPTVCRVVGDVCGVCRRQGLVSEPHMSFLSK